MSKLAALRGVPHLVTESGLTSGLGVTTNPHVPFSMPRNNSKGKRSVHYCMQLDEWFCVYFYFPLPREWSSFCHRINCLPKLSGSQRQVVVLPVLPFHRRHHCGARLSGRLPCPGSCKQRKGSLSGGPWAGYEQDQGQSGLGEAGAGGEKRNKGLYGNENFWKK